MPHQKHAPAVAALIVGGALLAPLLPTQSAHAADRVVPDSAGVFTLEGRGHGHGRGMSQWGSYQQAVEGRTWRQILAFYYPGARVTTRTSNPTIRVSTTGQTGSTARVAAESGLVAADGAGQKVSLATSSDGEPVIAWEVAPPSSGGSTTTATLWFHTATGRKALRSTGSGRWSITAPDGSLQLQNRQGRTVGTYLGRFTGNRSGSGIVPVLATDLENYTRQVVPWENYGSWPVQAQAAQSVAARSYGAWYLSHPKHRFYDICDTTSCQVFRGITAETDQTRKGVAASARTVLAVSGQPVRSEFSASNGGHTAPGGVSFTTVKTDPHEERLPVSVTSWRGTVTAKALARRWPGVGTVTGLVVTGRDGHGRWGGRVTRLRVEGTRGSVSISPGQLSGLASTYRGAYFTLVPSKGGSTPKAPAAKAARAGLTRDTNGDGRTELLSRDSRGRLTSTRLDSATRQGPSRLIGGGWQVFSQVFTGRFTQDGRADLLAVTRGGEILLYPSTGPGFASRKVVARGMGGYRNFGLEPNGARVLAQRRSDGALVGFAAGGRGTMSSRATVLSPRGWQGRDYTAMLVVPDFTGDGRVDLMVRHRTGRLLLSAGRADGRFDAPVAIGTGWQAFSSLAPVDDLTGDGRSEILARLPGGGTRLYPSNSSTPGRFGTRRDLPASKGSLVS